MVTVVFSTITCDEFLLPWEWLSIYLLMGSREWILCFALLACTDFASLGKLSLTQSMSSHTFTFLILFLILTGDCMVLGCLLGLNNTRLSLHFKARFPLSFSVVFHVHINT